MTTARPGLPLLLAVAAGGALGGTLRWWLGDLVPDGDGFPWTTFAINVTGSLALAALPALAAVRRRPLLPWGWGRASSAATPPCRRTPSRDARCSPTAAQASRRRTWLGTLAACLVAVTLAGRCDLAAGAAVVRRRGRQRVTPLLVACGAAARRRRSASGSAHHLDGRTPWGTLLVNVAGSFVLGLVVGAQPLAGRARPARHRLLRRPDHLLGLRRADP